MKEVKKVKLANPSIKEIEALGKKGRIELIQKERQKIRKLKAQIFSLEGDFRKDEADLLKQKEILEEKKSNIKMIGRITKRRIKELEELNEKTKNILFRLEQKRKNTLKKVEQITKKFLAIVRLIDLVEEVELKAVMKQENIGYEAARKYITRSRAITHKKLGRLPGGRT